MSIDLGALTPGTKLRLLRPVLAELTTDHGKCRRLKQGTKLQFVHCVGDLEKIVDTGEEIQPIAVAKGRVVFDITASRSVFAVAP